MKSRVITAIAVLALLPQWSTAQETRKDATADLLARLRKPVDLIPGNTVKLTELADLLTEKYGVNTTINVSSFTTLVGEAPADSEIAMLKVKGLPLGATLRQVLSEKGATYLVRKSHIEIVPIGVAAKEAKIPGIDDDGTTRLTQPLVSAIYKEKPLNEALADLAEEHDLTVVLAPQAADQKAAFVSARMLNVPADKAIEMLALQADLRVVKKGSSFFVTSKDHAGELHNEKFEKEKQRAELDAIRTPAFPFGQGQPPK